MFRFFKNDLGDSSRARCRKKSNNLAGKRSSRKETTSGKVLHTHTQKKKKNNVGTEITPPIPYASPSENVKNIELPVAYGKCFSKSLNIRPNTMKQYSNQLRMSMSMSHRIIVSDIWIRGFYLGHPLVPAQAPFHSGSTHLGTIIYPLLAPALLKMMFLYPKGGYLNFLEGIPSLRVLGTPPSGIQLETPKVKWHLAVHLVHCYCRHHQWDYLGAVLKK